eukprot:3950638-Pyramimonas_sp.AAC.1
MNSDTMFVCFVGLLLRNGATDEDTKLVETDVRAANLLRQRTPSSRPVRKSAPVNIVYPPLVTRARGSPERTHFGTHVATHEPVQIRSSRSSDPVWDPKSDL